MGTAHLKPNGTRSRYTEIADYRTLHIDGTQLDDRLEAEMYEDIVIEQMTDRTALQKIRGGYKWIQNRGVDDKVIAETKHGIELRLKYHPSGSVYFNLVVTTGEFNQENLAIQHLDKYNEELKEVLEGVYGEVYRQNGRWTSKKVTI